MHFHALHTKQLKNIFPALPSNLRNLLIYTLLQTCFILSSPCVLGSSYLRAVSEEEHLVDESTGHGTRQGVATIVKVERDSRVDAHREIVGHSQLLIRLT